LGGLQTIALERFAPRQIVSLFPTQKIHRNEGVVERPAKPTFLKRNRKRPL
jgi:hypothetical protein